MPKTTESDSITEKDSSEDLEQSAQAGDPSEHRAAKSRPKKTTPDSAEVVPQPSDDPRDPLVGDIEAFVRCATLKFVL